MSTAPFDGGAEKSLFTYLSGSSAVSHVLIVHTNTRLSPEIQKVNEVYRLPFAWFVKTYNPLLLLQFVANWIYCSIHIFLIAKKHGVSIVFANTFKTYLFTLLTKVLIRLKLIVCLRDNLSAVWQKKMLFISDQIITISGHIQDQLDHKESAQVIHPCVKQTNISPIKDPFAKKQPGQLIIATIGQLAPWKGQLAFLKLAETFKSNDQIKFLIIGDDQSNANQSYRNQVIQQAESLKNVQFLGHVEQVGLLLKKIDVLVHLAQDEPFGRVIVEAMHARKAVIALRSGGIPEIIEQGKSGLLVDQELALFQSRKAILELYESPAKRLIMGREAHKRAQRFTDMDFHIHQVNQLLKSVHAR
ncbi:MAG: glycosyltransferase family 4 protein [Cytophagales bacterium]|nr:glycosyltransferase family 4 protein [Cytophagales bacterium]